MSQRFRFRGQRRPSSDDNEPPSAPSSDPDKDDDEDEGEGETTERVQNNYNDETDDDDDDDADYGDENDDDNNDPKDHDDGGGISDERIGGGGQAQQRPAVSGRRRAVNSEATSSSDLSQQSTSMRMESVKSRMRLQREQSLSLLQAVHGPGPGAFGVAGINGSGGGNGGSGNNGGGGGGGSGRGNNNNNRLGMGGGAHRRAGGGSGSQGHYQHHQQQQQHSNQSSTTNLRNSSQSSLSYNHNPSDYNNHNDHNNHHRHAYGGAGHNSINSVSSHNPILDERSNIRRSIMMVPGSTSFALYANAMAGMAGTGNNMGNMNMNLNNHLHGANNNNNAGGRQHHHQMRRRSFAVQSIHRGTQEWHGMLQPFVADLVFRSVASRRYQSDETGVLFRPYSCQAALLFCDLSGYSKITAAIAHKGAHVLSAAVNAYLSLLVRILREHGGDVVKFAGDAILAVWEGDEQELEINVLCAARCAVALQEQAGEHIVDHNKNLAFHIHCAVACGPLDSEIFEATQNSHMQKLYHFVGGDGVEEVGELVDLAASGEIAISNNCFNFLEQEGSYEPIPSSKNGAKLLRSLSLQDNELLELMDWHTNKLIDERLEMRDREIEESFIHRSVLAHLNHGGLSPTQIAQMRNLCVLFIAMVSTNSSPVVDWLMEVQTILDRNRCPIVQIIHDDKGVHIVAAINLYEAVPEASILGLNVCAELVHQRLGAAVGMAQGSTFCGVTGSTDACRWDITGPAVVRAARLMQYAIQHGHPCIIDESLYEEDPMAATRLRLVDPNVRLKGNPSPICVFTISANDVTSFAAFWILNNEHGGIHDTKIQEIQNHISCRTRSAVLVTGIPLAGSVIACQRAAGYSDLVPYLHVSQVSAGFLQLAKTIATWFLYCGSGAKQYPEIVELAEAVLDDMKANRWSCAHDQCVRLVNLAVEKHDLKACFVVDRTQDLDRFSLSLIRAILRKPRTMCTTTTSTGRVVMVHHRHDDSMQMEKFSMSVSMDLQDRSECLGQVCFLCTHVALYGAAPTHPSRSPLSNWGRPARKNCEPCIEIWKIPRWGIAG
jgi:class 3 adenylate cyclase